MNPSRRSWLSTPAITVSSSSNLLTSSCVLPYTQVLWRQKEQFSDGVGYNWIDGLRAHADAMVSDEQLKHAHNRWGLVSERVPTGV
jgi:hypothetical protein